MKVLGLISGGKDSIFNLMKCIAAGHDIVALGNIHPAGTEDELNSFMYQTVGHEAINYVAQAMGLPIFRQTTKAKAFCEDLQYRESANDEVEDLHTLVKNALNNVKFEGVAVGAIASDYQRLRVENVCVRLGLTCLAYLWQENQSKLLEEMISCKVDAILIKVATLGLMPHIHLGKNIKDIQSTMTNLNRMYGSNICGEGGEYETFVMNCPLYHRKIVLDTAEIQSDATSGHFRLNEVHLEDNFPSEKTPSDTWSERQLSVRNILPKADDYIAECLADIPLVGREDVYCDPDLETLSTEMCNVSIRMEASSSWYSGSVLAANIDEAITVLKAGLKGKGMTLSNVVCTNLWLRDMGEFAAVNQAYVRGMDGVSPARACVAVPLPPETPILLEVLAHPTKTERCHVQGYSHWAPANIGPYSQSGKVGNVIILAGQIPLVPGSMTLLNAPLAHQIRLAMRHAERVLKISKASLKHVVQASVYVVSEKNVALAVKMVKAILQGIQTQVVGIVVSTLPRNADVEIQLIAAAGHKRSSRKISTFALSTMQFHISSTFGNSGTVITGWLTPDGMKELSCDDLRSFLSQCITNVQCGSRAITFRVFYRHDVPNLGGKVISALRELNAMEYASIVPVICCESMQQVITVVGLSLDDENITPS